MAIITKDDEGFLKGLRGPAHWSEGDAKRVLALLEASGQSRAAFAKRHGLRATRIAWWRDRLADWDREPLETSEEPWVELVASGTREAHPPIVARVRVGELEIELTTLDEKAVRFLARLAAEMSA